MTCPTGKRVFERRRDAKRYMRRIQCNPASHVRRVYRCPHCDGWHMTSQRPDAPREAA